MTKIRIWMCVDPSPNSCEAPRIWIQTRPIGEHDLPPHRGPRVGQLWPIRELDVDESALQAILRADVTPEESDRLHQQWWNDAAPEGAPPWPSID